MLNIVQTVFSECNLEVFVFCHLNSISGGVQNSEEIDLNEILNTFMEEFLPFSCVQYLEMTTFEIFSK